MTSAIDVYRKLPVSTDQEAELVARLAKLGGRLDCREETSIPGVCSTLCLTFEFSDYSQAETAAGTLQSNGEHVEGPYSYGD